MKTKATEQSLNELERLCASVRALVADGEYKRCTVLICEAMESNPHAPHPHNLLGVVLEKQGDHATAMKHFRAAWALDPTYTPASHNLNTYGTFFAGGKCAFDESDVVTASSGNIEIVYDDRGVGRVVAKSYVQYDKHGIGHVVRR